MRSGSTLAGVILGWRDDTFYLYEPLWKISRWTYWHGNRTLCRADRLECRQVEAEKALSERRFYGNARNISGSLVLALKILRKFYDCQFNDFERVVLETGITIRLGGPSWSQVNACTRGKKSPRQCVLQFAPRLCKNATHRVTKVLRLTTDLLEGLLKQKPDLKVLHLFRDPRAIINSRINTGWYPIKNVTDNARSLCKKMLYDFRKGKELLEIYPDRFKFIIYEDVTTSTFEKVQSLYRYLGMSLNESRYTKVKTMPVFQSKNASDRKNNTAYWWRMSLDWDNVQKIDRVCEDVYKELGYRTFKNIDEYKNMSYVSFDGPKNYMIS